MEFNNKSKSQGFVIWPLILNFSAISANSNNTDYLLWDYLREFVIKNHKKPGFSSAVPRKNPRNKKTSASGII